MANSRIRQLEIIENDFQRQTADHNARLAIQSVKADRIANESAEIQKILESGNQQQIEAALTRQSQLEREAVVVRAELSSLRAESQQMTRDFNASIDSVVGSSQTAASVVERSFTQSPTITTQAATANSTKINELRAVEADFNAWRAKSNAQQAELSQRADQVVADQQRINLDLASSDPAVRARALQEQQELNSRASALAAEQRAFREENTRQSEYYNKKIDGILANDNGRVAGENQIDEDGGVSLVDADIDESEITSGVASFDWPIQPRPNPLSKFSHYSYVISWYLINAEQYNQLTREQVKEMTGFQLLMQTGGAPANTLTVESVNAALSQTQNLDGVNRNPYFDVDFFIDKVEFKSIIAGKGSGSPTPQFEFSMSVTEPYGMSLIQRMQLAIDQLANNGAGGSGSLTYLAQTYLLVIRFYGYDEQGNLVSNNNADLSDSTAISEKFFPFTIKNLTFKLGSEGTSYEIDGVPLSHAIAISDTYGSIPFNVELSAETVKELLLGEAQVRPPEESEEDLPSAQAQKATVTRGLVAAINEFNRQQVDNDAAKADGILPNEIAIEFAEGFGIENATLARIGPTSLSQTSMTQETRADLQLLASKNQVAKNDRTFSVTAGMQIIQFLDLVIRSSSYITDQQLYEIEEKETASGDPVRNIVFKERENNESPLWFKIETKTEIIGVSISGKPAYRNIYRIVPYKPIIEHPAIGLTDYQGSFKRYDYWFTGLNTEVLSFEQNFNMLYYQVIGPEDQQIIQNQRKTYNRHEIRNQVVQFGSAETEQGGLRDSNSISARVAESLYSIADQQTAKLKILGDPDWIDEEPFRNTSSFAPWLPDGFNMGAYQPVYEVNFNLPDDYNLDTGLMEVNQNNYGRNKATNQAGDPSVNYLYAATIVTSTFANGEFTQDIEGYVPDFSAREDRNVVQRINEDRVLTEPEAPPVELTERNARAVERASERQQRIVNAWESETTNPMLTPRQQEEARQALERQNARNQPVAIYARELERAEQEVIAAQSFLNNIQDPSVDGGFSQQFVPGGEKRLAEAVANRDNLRAAYMQEATSLTRQVRRDD